MTNPSENSRASDWAQRSARRMMPRAWWNGLTVFERWIAILMAGWVLAMISLPILKWVVGKNVLPIGISVGVLFQLIAVYAILVWVWGTRRANLLTGVIVVCAWGVEYIGHTTGFPFGGYRYTDQLQPQLGGVPLLIPLAWMMMLPPSWAVAQRIADRFKQRRAALIIVSALAFTAWDLFLDPQMVGWSLWLWDQPSGYFGIPLVNFAGWLAAAAAITLLASWIAPLERLPARPLIAIYAISWALETVGLLVFWGLPGPALVGTVVMGAILLWAIKAS